MNPRDDVDGALTANVEGKELVIRIGVERLTWCLRYDDGRMKGCRIRDWTAFAKDVSRELMRDNEVGATKMMDLLQLAAEDAWIQGSEHCRMETRRSSKTNVHGDPRWGKRK